jgi:hypothetical protein
MPFYQMPKQATIDAKGDGHMTAWTIDKVCQLTSNPTVLNALHACRPDHPWNKDAVRPWFSAYFIAAQQPSYVIPSDAIAWLLERAADEKEAA